MLNNTHAFNTSETRQPSLYSYDEFDAQGGDCNNFCSSFISGIKKHESETIEEKHAILNSPSSNKEEAFKVHDSNGSKRQLKEKRKNKSFTRQLWKNEEDDAIMQLVEKYGKKKWTLIANKLKEDFKIFGKTGKQCRERYYIYIYNRWHNHLDPEVSKEPFTMEEETLIFEEQKRHTGRWSDIAKQIKGRTDNAIKNYFYSILRKELRKVLREINAVSNKIPKELNLNQIRNLMKKHNIAYDCLENVNVKKILIWMDENEEKIPSNKHDHEAESTQNLQSGSKSFDDDNSKDLQPETDVIVLSKPPKKRTSTENPINKELKSPKRLNYNEAPKLNTQKKAAIQPKHFIFPDIANPDEPENVEQNKLPMEPQKYNFWEDPNCMFKPYTAPEMVLAPSFSFGMFPLSSPTFRNVTENSESFFPLPSPISPWLLSPMALNSFQLRMPNTPNMEIDERPGEYIPI